MEDIALPSCKCDLESVEKTVTKETANKGKRFFACSKGMNDGCGFFEWSPSVREPGAGGGRVVPQKRGRPVSFSFSFRFRLFAGGRERELIRSID